MDKLNCMKAFCEVVKAGSFSAGANNLGISKVLTSRYIAKLEQHLGIRLLQRTTRKMSLTNEGQEYFQRCQSLLGDFDELENSTKDKYQGVHGRLRISVPSQEFTCNHLIPFLSQFATQYPDIELDINLSDHYTDIVEQGYDLAIRIGQLEDSSLIAKRLASAEIILCASSNYLKKVGVIAHPSDIEAHKLIVDTNFRGGKSWKFSNNLEQYIIPTKGKIRLNSSMAVRSFLSADLGIGICPSFIVDQEILSGDLQRILPNWSLMNLGIYVLYSNKKQLSPKISTFVNAISTYYQGKKEHT